jgi:radical SAM-linked protein
MSNEEFKAKIIYSKTCQARYIAHLDTIDVISKSLRRLQLPYAVTQGCHARPKLTFGPPLPLGHASFCEFFIISLVEKTDAEALKNSLNRELPQGMQVIEVILPFTENKRTSEGDQLSYRFTFSDKVVAEKAISFLSSPDVTFSVDRKGKNRDYRLGDAVRKAELINSPNGAVINAEFVQGIAEVPSVSKIVTALADNLGDDRDSLRLIERVAQRELTRT